MRALFALVLVCLTAAADPVRAAPVVYDEATGGDINDSGFTTFAFDRGTNRITGRVRFVVLYDDTGAFAGFDIDVDPFRFTLPSGTSLRSGRIDASFVDTTANTSLMEAGWDVILEDGTVVAQACWTLVGAPLGCDGTFGGGVFFDGLDLPDSLFLVGNPRFSGWNPVIPFRSSGGDIAYTLSFDVVAISEPGGLSIALSAWLVAALLGRRRRPAQQREEAARPDAASGI